MASICVPRTALLGAALLFMACSDGSPSAPPPLGPPPESGDELLVVDSTVLHLLSDSAERAQGVLRFEVRTGAPLAPAIGDVVVGVQAGGFLRRVTAASRSDSTLILQTEQAALANVVETGRFATAVDLFFEPGVQGQLAAQSAVLRPGTVAWGAGEFRGMVAGMSVSRAGFDLSHLDICALLKEASGGSTTCPEQIKKLEIATGRLDFSPELQMEAEFDGFSLQQFRGVAKGSLDLELALALEAEGALGEMKHDVDFFTFTRPFFMQLGVVPVIGYVELQLTGAVTVKATAKAAFEAGIQATSSVELGAEYHEDSWSPVSTSDGSFDPQPPSVGDSTLSAAIEVEAKVSMKPRLQIIFYGVVGPFAQVEPFGSATLTFGATECALTGASGIDAALGFTVPFLDDDVMDFDKEWSPLVNGPGSNWECPLGIIDVSTTTNGADTDNDGYQVQVDANPPESIGPTAHVIVPFVQVGERTVTLTGVAANCTVQDGATRTVTVATGGMHPVNYTIDCSAQVGTLDVATTTSGENIDSDGYTVSVDGGAAVPIPANGTLSIDGIAEGEHTIGLGNVAVNCRVAGANPVTATVAEGATANVSFNVSCSASELVVRTSTTGPPATEGDWTVTLDGADPRTISSNGQVTWSTTAEVHMVELDGLPANCRVDGTNPATVTVDVATPTEHVFNVTCESGTLTVNVITETSDSSIMTFEVRTDGQSKTVGINGSTAFDLPTGTHAVQLVVPANCTVAGLNPRDATVPGSVDFEVTCELPLECPAEAPDASITENVYIDYTDTGGPYEQEVRTATWGHVAGSASATGSADAGMRGTLVTMELGWNDYVAVVPVDSSAIGDFMVLKAIVSGSITLDGAGEEPAVLTHYWTGINAAGVGYPRFQDDRRLPDDVGTFAQTDTAYFAGQVGDWIEFRAYMALNVGGGGQSSVSSSEASMQIDRLIGVYDQITGELIPVRQLCTASGATYPE